MSRERTWKMFSVHYEADRIMYWTPSWLEMSRFFCMDNRAVAKHVSWHR